MRNWNLHVISNAYVWLLALRMLNTQNINIQSPTSTTADGNHQQIPPNPNMTDGTTPPLTNDVTKLHVKIHTWEVADVRISQSGEMTPRGLSRQGGSGGEWPTHPPVTFESADPVSFQPPEDITPLTTGWPASHLVGLNWWKFLLKRHLILFTAARSLLPSAPGTGSPCTCDSEPERNKMSSWIISAIFFTPWAPEIASPGIDRCKCAGLLCDLSDWKELQTVTSFSRYSMNFTRAEKCSLLVFPAASGKVSRPHLGDK